MINKTKQVEMKGMLIETLQYLTNKGLSCEDIIELTDKLLKAPPKEITVPLSIFKNDYLSALEAIVKYLRENLKLRFKEIASLTNRNEIALAVTNRNANKKLEAEFVYETSPYDIPILVLKDRKLSVLENIVTYLKDTFNFTYHQIAIMLNRNDRTIWTVYQRAKRKNQ